MKTYLFSGILALSVLPFLAASEEALALPVAKVAAVEDFQTKGYPGKVVPVAQVNIVSRVNGEILELGFRNGDVVKQGQLLYLLDSVKYEAAVKNAEAKVAEFKAKTAYAESSYHRNKQLSDINAVSQDTMESTLSARNAFQASVAAAEADLISAKDDLEHCRIIAPIDGKAGTTNFTEGNYVTTNSGTLVTLVQTSPIRVRFSISNRDYLTMFGGSARSIRDHGAVKLILANGLEYAEAGKIDYVDNTANDSTDTIQVFALLNNKDRALVPGGTVGVFLSSKAGVKKPAVAPSAIMQDIKGAYVWIVGEGNVVQKQYVIRGNITKDLQLIDSGLKAGDVVVTDGTHKVSSGDKIRPVMR